MEHHSDGRKANPSGLQSVLRSVRPWVGLTGVHLVRRLANRSDKHSGPPSERVFGLVQEVTSSVLRSDLVKASRSGSPKDLNSANRSGGHSVHSTVTGLQPRHQLEQTWSELALLETEWSDRR